MHISVNVPQSPVKLCDVDCGQVFAIESKVYIKTDKFGQGVSTVVELSTGKLVDLEDNPIVIILNTILVEDREANMQIDNRKNNSPVFGEHTITLC